MGKLNWNAKAHGWESQEVKGTTFEIWPNQRGGFSLYAIKNGEIVMRRSFRYFDDAKDAAEALC